MTPVPVLLISGPVGVGKTTVAERLSGLLAEREISHTLIDMDALRQTHPRPQGDRFGLQLGLLNLRDVWANCALAGSRNLILPHVVETATERDQIESCIEGARLHLVQLSARADTLRSRLERREQPDSLAHQLARSIELRDVLSAAPADQRLATDDLSATEIAEHLFDGIAWA